MSDFSHLLVSRDLKENTVFYCKDGEVRANKEILGAANSIFARILFNRDIVEPIVGVEVTVPVKKSSYLLFL